MKIRALIIDDERLARERIRALLTEESAIEIVGECANGRDAVAAIRKQSPDLIFLDVQMPELDGFGVLAEIEPAQMPAVIFVTAYDRFAVKAFEVHAVDYLLKPFDQERFHDALSRVIDHLKSRRTDALRQHLAELLSDLKSDTKSTGRLVVKSQGRVLLVRTKDIDWVEAADNYVVLHVGNETHLLRETMASLETRLTPDRFVRISRSAMVNLDRVKEMQPLFHGDYAVLLQDGTRLTLSRSHREKLNSILGHDS